ncbi:DUF6263 family protein [Allomuricauda sp. d1]|uniref:DUF6263 family protein n=1 Tax=Allomuricauda sp. d1 TaxID=3136725 RepID=UPI0031D92F0B
MCRILKSVVLGLFVLSSFLVQAQVDLGYTLEVGQNFRIKQNANQLMIQTLEGSSHEITNELEGLFTFEVTSKTDTGYDLALKFEDFALKSSSSIQGTLIDVRASEPVDGDMMSAIFNGLIGYELTVKMGALGQITTVEGGEGLIQNMIANAGIEDEFTANLMKKSLEGEFGTESLAKSFEQMTFFYPKEKIAVGETWTNKHEGKLSSENIWKLEKIENGMASITGDADITVNNEDENLKMNLTGKQETALEASIENGFIKKMMVSSMAEGNSTMPQMGSAEIPTKLESTITYELID